MLIAIRDFPTLQANLLRCRGFELDEQPMMSIDDEYLRLDYGDLHFTILMSDRVRNHGAPPHPGLEEGRPKLDRPVEGQGSMPDTPFNGEKLMRRVVMLR